jgi:O-antigen ligase
MLVLVALAAYVLTDDWRRRLWAIPIGLGVAAALYLSETRSALLGAVAGIILVLVLLKRRKAILALLALLPLLYLTSPQSFQQRLRGGLDPRDANTKNRIELIGTATRLIQAHPWLGVGQRVSREALRYRGTNEFPDYLYLHMHNNFLQIAAERGIPGLILWLWFMFQLGWQAFRVTRAGTLAAGTPRSGAVRFAAVAALGGWVALLSAGMFEYNFGDSEVLTLFLFMMSAPHAAQAGDAEP